MENEDLRDSYHFFQIKLICEKMYNKILSYIIFIKGENIF